MLPKMPKYPDGEFLGTLLGKDNRKITDQYRENFDRTFGKKPLQHGRDREKVEEPEIKPVDRGQFPELTAEAVEKWLDDMAAKKEAQYKTKLRPQTATDALVAEYEADGCCQKEDKDER